MAKKTIITLLIISLFLLGCQTTSEPENYECGEIKSKLGLFECPEGMSEVECSQQRRDQIEHPQCYKSKYNQKVEDYNEITKERRTIFDQLDEISDKYVAYEVMDYNDFYQEDLEKYFDLLSKKLHNDDIYLEWIVNNPDFIKEQFDYSNSEMEEWINELKEANTLSEESKLLAGKVLYRRKNG